MTWRKRSSRTFSSSGLTFGFSSRRHSAKECTVLGSWRSLALLQLPSDSAGTESRAPCQQPLQRCANSNGIRRGQCFGLIWTVLSSHSWLMVRPQIPDTCVVRSQRQSTSNCGHGRRGTSKEWAHSKELTGTPPDCTSHSSESVASTRRQNFSWLVSRGLYGLCSGNTSALAAAKPHLTQPARVAKRAAQRLSCTDIGYVLEICLIIPMKRRSKRINDYLVGLKQRQRTHLACGSEAFTQLRILWGCCYGQPLRRRQWSLEQEVLPPQVTSLETKRREIRP